MKKNDWNLLISVALYSFLFYKQTPGINFLILNVALIAFLIIREPLLVKNKIWQASAIFSLVTAICITFYGDWLSFSANIVSLSLLSAQSISKDSSVFMAILYSMFSYITAFSYVIIDIIEKKLPHNHEKKSSFGIKFIYAIIIIAIVILFFLLYRASNPLFKDFTKYIKLDFISWHWVWFTFLGFLILYGFFFSKELPWFREKDVAASDNLNKDYILALPEKKGIFDLITENKLGTLLFVLLNLMIFILNTLDVIYLWANAKLPEGMTYADSVHQGIWAIIISIVIAILIILYLFRGKLNYFETNKTIKTLAAIWILQNILMIVSTCYRNVLYVNEYDLTYKRIGVFIYLILAIVGLATTFIKIYQIKSTWFLFRKNGWAIIIILVLASCMNWDVFITNYNIEQARKNPAKKLDTKYLLELTHSNIPILIGYFDTLKNKDEFKNKLTPEQYINYNYDYEPNRYYGASYQNMLHTKIFNFLNSYNEESWRSWSYYKHYVVKEIINYEKKGALKELDLSSNQITDLTPIEDFTNLEKLDISFNRMDSLSSLKNFKNLAYLNLNSNYLYKLKGLPELENLRTLYLINNSLENLENLNKVKNLEYLDVSNNYNLIFSSMPELKKLSYLDVSNISINDFTFLKKFPELKTLIVANMPNKEGLMLPNLPKLECLNLKNNGIVLTDKKFFETIKSFKQINDLNLADNKIENLMVLTSVDIKAKSVTPIFENLKKLDVTDNNITNLEPLKYFENLNSLTLAGNVVDTVSGLLYIKNLEELDMRNCSLKEFSIISKLENIKKLNLSQNSIAIFPEIPVNNKIIKLNLNSNTISDLQFVANLKLIEDLDVSNNRIVDITALKNLKNIKILDLRNNNINDFEALYNLKTLEKVYLPYISNEAFIKLQKRLPRTNFIRIDDTYRNIYS